MKFESVFFDRGVEDGRRNSPALVLVDGNGVPVKTDSGDVAVFVSEMCLAVPADRIIRRKDDATV